MKKVAYLIINFSCWIHFTIALIIGSVVILSDPLSSDSFFCYSYLIIIQIIINFSKNTELSRYKNIFKLCILNLVAIIMPITVLYILGIIIGDVFTRSFGLVNMADKGMNYLEFMFFMIRKGSIYNLFLPLFISIGIAIFILCIYNIKQKWLKA